MKISADIDGLYNIKSAKDGKFDRWLNDNTLHEIQININPESNIQNDWHYFSKVARLLEFMDGDTIQEISDHIVAKWILKEIEFPDKEPKKEIKEGEEEKKDGEVDKKSESSLSDDIPDSNAMKFGNYKHFSTIILELLQKFIKMLDKYGDEICTREVYKTELIRLLCVVEVFTYNKINLILINKTNCVERLFKLAMLVEKHRLNELK